MVYNKVNVLACALVLLLFSYIALQVPARPFDVTLSSNSTNSIPQETRQIVDELDFHERVRRSLDNNPCYIPKSFTRYKNYFTVECYESSPTGCLHNINKYGTTKCKPIYTSYGRLSLIQDCACA